MDVDGGESAQKLPGMHDIFLARLQSQLIDLSLARQAHETAASDTGITPMCQTL